MAMVKPLGIIFSIALLFSGDLFARSPDSELRLNFFKQSAAQVLQDNLQIEKIDEYQYEIISSSGAPKIDFYSHFSIESHDGVHLSANFFIPSETAPKGLMVFINTWAMEEHEYIIRAYQFARQGYGVLSYSTRGFGNSEGVVKIGAQEDIQDVSAVANWIFNKFSFASEEMGVCGISYGGIIALLAAAFDQRVRAVLPMSAGIDLMNSIYGNQTPRLVWSSLLLLAGKFSGRLDPIIDEYYMDVLRHRRIEHITEWAAERSPINYLEKLNQNAPAIYMSHNWLDYLFPINDVLKFYEAYRGPKQIDLNLGMHASYEILGMLQRRHYIWEQAIGWIRKWVGSAKDEGGPTRLPVGMVVKNSRKRVWYHGTKDPGFEQMNISLRPSTPSIPVWKKEKTIFSGRDSSAKTGIPVVSEFMESRFKVPVRLDLNRIRKLRGTVFFSPILGQKIELRGIQTSSFWIKTRSEKFQVVAYLYDVAPNGVGTLISHGVFSRHQNHSTQAQNINIDFLATAYDVSQGHRMAVVIDTFDALYAVPTFSPYQLKFVFDRMHPSLLSLSAK